MQLASALSGVYDGDINDKKSNSEFSDNEGEETQNDAGGVQHPGGKYAVKPERQTVEKQQDDVDIVELPPQEKVRKDEKKVDSGCMPCCSAM